MARQLIRIYKRAVQAGSRQGADDNCKRLARTSALSLLERSIGFGHGRLAVIRLDIAVCAGADVPEEHWSYCRTAAETSRDITVKALFVAAQERAGKHGGGAHEAAKIAANSIPGRAN